LLLGLITALVVARPLVLGEDPGLLDHSSSGTGLVLTLLWFLAALGWAVWRAWSGQATWSWSSVEGGLLAVVGAIVVSAIGAASYKQPAWLIATEWLVFLIAFVLIRQLAQTEGDNRRLLAALMASAVSLSAYAVYQRTVEMPTQHQELENPQKLVQALTKEGIYLDEKDPVLEHWKKRVQANAVFATFAHPNSFASYLALLLPAAVGWSLAGWSQIGRSLKTWLAAACALLMSIALWLTNGRGAILASIVTVGAVFALNRTRSVSDGSASPIAKAPGSDKRRLLGIASAAIAAVLLVFLLNRTDALKEEAPETLQKRLDYWSATVRMIRDHPWLGVGPGHFGRFYPRYMNETAFQKITDPHNFVLEIWATCGILALLALLIALATFFWQTRRAWFAPELQQEKEPDQGRIHWEFYLGGMAGLILGFVLWTMDLSQQFISDQLIYGGFVAGMRSLVWFAAFGLFESLPWNGSGRARALILGLVALLANLMVSGGITYPSVALPMWVVAALAVNSMGKPAVAPGQKRWLSVMWPLPVTAVACLGFYLFIYSPVANCTGHLREARRWNASYFAKREEAQTSNSAAAGQKVGSDAQDILKHIVDELQLSAWGSRRHKEEAPLADPYTELAQWLADEWRLSMRQGREQIDIRHQAALAADKAIKLDPEGSEGYWAKYQANMIFAKGSTMETRKFLEFAAQAMEKLAAKNPTDARFHYQLADLRLQLDDLAGWEAESREAVRLDEIATDPTRKLKPSQRLQIQARQDPTNLSLRFELAQALFSEGDVESGRKVAEEVQRMDRETNTPAKLTDAQREQIQAWLKSR
jgi:O-Antigen ligase